MIAGRFMVSLSSWSARACGLDVWYAAKGGEKLVRFMWSGDDFSIGTFKRPREWAPELLALAERPETDALN